MTIFRSGSANLRIATEIPSIVKFTMGAFETQENSVIEALRKHPSNQNIAGNHGLFWEEDPSVSRVVNGQSGEISVHHDGNLSEEDRVKLKYLAEQNAKMTDKVSTVVGINWAIERFHISNMAKLGKNNKPERVVGKLDELIESLKESGVYEG